MAEIHMKFIDEIQKSSQGIMQGIMQGIGWFEVGVATWHSQHVSQRLLRIPERRPGLSSYLISPGVPARTYLLYPPVGLNRNPVREHSACSQSKTLRASPNAG